MTYPTRSQRPIAESGRADNSDEETTDVMEPTSSQRGAEPVDAAADPSTRAVMPDDGQQPDQKPRPDEYPHAGDNQQADPETSAERGPEPADRSTQPPAATTEATAYANADAGHDTADERTRAHSDSKLAPSHLADDPVSVRRRPAQRARRGRRPRRGGHCSHAPTRITAQKQTLDGWQSADSDDTEV